MTHASPSGRDSVLPFLLHQGAFRGRLVRLPDTAADILGRHDYPPAVARLVAEAAALAGVLAYSMKFDGLFTLQAQGDGPVHMLVADVTSAGEVRACARFDDEAVAALAAQPAGEDANVQRLLGAGHLAFTVDQGPDTNRYQGIVELQGASLADCVHQYFRRSEQLETAIKVAAGLVDGAWRSSALMIQRMPAGGGVNTPVVTEEEAEDAWRTAVVLLGSLTRDELLDPALPGEQVLYRLFHQEALGIAEARPLRFGCRCSRERVEMTLASFPAGELADMRRPDGTIGVHCQFCGTEYAVTDSDLDALRAKGQD
ncbi:Hsp33 family molecular chaperone HslO [Novispirillum sp. DQ9]|uniref:Hsp33 family molecular chaperone HslO n=1 Tax=Novispirillum sp. DQ9 TaxID=3398612 RepID=UPI003C7C3611